MRMTMSSRYLDSQINVLDRLGFSREACIAALDIQPSIFGNPLARVPISLLTELFHSAEEALGDHYIGLRVGFRFRINSYAQTGSIYGFCENLAQVISMNGRYQRLAVDAGVISYDCEDDRHYMSFRPYYPNGPAHRHLTDSIMGAYGTAYRWLSWGSGQDLIQAELPYEAPEDMALHDRVFQAPIIFNAPVARLEFSAEAMMERLTTYDPEKLKRAQLRLEHLMDQDRTAQTFKDAVNEAIKGALGEGVITAGIVAERLGSTELAFRQNLKQNNLSYRHMVETVRQDMFYDLFETGMSFSAIAQALGYNDQAAFNRAFKRWFDMSPGAWKKAQAQS